MRKNCSWRATHLVRLVSAPTDDELVGDVEQDADQKTDRGDDRLDDRVDHDDGDDHTHGRPEGTEFKLVLRESNRLASGQKTM